MPISPQEALRLSKVKNGPEFKALCKRIDAMLVEGGRTFATSLLGDIPWTDIKDTYVEVGWSVSLAADWRDGDYLEFW